MKIEAVSQQDNDDAAGRAEAGAGRRWRRPRPRSSAARINLAYTRVTSPIAGRIGRSPVTAGALVTANQADALATVQQLDPIYVDITQSSAELLRLKRDLESGKLQRSRATTPCRCSWCSKTAATYAPEGKLEFSEVTVDPSTGSVTLRAVFPNPEGRTAARHVRARAADAGHAGRSAFLVPQRR